MRRLFRPNCPVQVRKSWKTLKISDLRRLRLAVNTSARGRGSPELKYTTFPGTLRSARWNKGWFRWRRSWRLCTTICFRCSRGWICHWFVSSNCTRPRWKLWCSRSFLSKNKKRSTLKSWSPKTQGLRVLLSDIATYLCLFAIFYLANKIYIIKSFIEGDGVWRLQASLREGRAARGERHHYGLSQFGVWK